MQRYDNSKKTIKALKQTPTLLSQIARYDGTEHHLLERVKAEK